MRYFETKFLEEVDKFISGLDRKTVKKIFIILMLPDRPMSNKT